MSAAVLQSVVRVGGRSKILAAIVDILQYQGHEVTIHTLAGNAETGRFFDHYDTNPREVNVVTHRGAEVPGTIYQQPTLNIAARSSLPNYDLVVNSNNCVRFLPHGPQYVHYVHFPPVRNPVIDPRYERLPFRIAAAPLKLLSMLSTPETDGPVLTNSRFTLEHAQAAFHCPNARVCYPPAIEEVEFSGFDGEGVVTLGSFHPNKRQLLQLDMARRFPDTQFRIIGSMSSESYYEDCEQYVHKHGLENVELLTNVDDRLLEDVLNRSAVFLHTMENEHFGIATVEGMNHGCIPLVHDSGGQREVVPDRDFRFDTPEECETRLDEVLSGSSPSVQWMKSHLEQFTLENFRSELSVAF